MDLRDGKMMDTVACINCGEPYPEVGIPYRCGKCGGLFDYKIWPAYNPDLIRHESHGIWRYRNFLGLSENSKEIYLGEGSTPLVWGNVSGQKVAFKCEYQNPTGSFKDRGSALLVSFLLSRNCQEAVEDSSGNAGSSFAAFAAKAGIKAKVFVPDSASGPKRKQIEEYGAELIKILGPRSNAAEAVQKAADLGAVYASHAFLPFNLPGYATIAYEIFEQIGTVPGVIIIPAGQGGLVLGIGRGFDAIYKAGQISHMPKIVAVQARACAPLWALFNYGPAGLGWVTEGETVAEGIRVRIPLRGDAVLNFLENNNGRVLSIEEEQIILGRDQLAKQGFYVETTSGVVWSAIETMIGHSAGPIVAILTGSGLKNFL